MNDSERAGLFLMRDCWITGGAASALAPQDWQQMVVGAAADERERLLLAIAGQALDIGFRPAAPKSLTQCAPLPKLTLPAVPDTLRPLFRAALKHADARGKMRVVSIAAVRGYVAHPMDWMPAASEINAPRIYSPWLDWQADANGKAGSMLEALTTENWDEFYPAARRIALADIRRTDPAQARSLLEAKAAGETAEARLALIELLRVNLSVADVPYLRSLSSDRSGKVKQLAARL